MFFGQAELGHTQKGPGVGFGDTQGTVMVPAMSLWTGTSCFLLHILFLCDWLRSAPHARNYSQSTTSISLMQGAEHS